MSPFTSPVIVFSFIPAFSLVQLPSFIPFFCHSIWYPSSSVYILACACQFPVHVTSPYIAFGISPTCTVLSTTCCSPSFVASTFIVYIPPWVKPLNVYVVASLACASPYSSPCFFIEYLKSLAPSALTTSISILFVVLFTTLNPISRFSPFPIHSPIIILSAISSFGSTVISNTYPGVVVISYVPSQLSILSTSLSAISPSLSILSQ